MHCSESRCHSRSPLPLAPPIGTATFGARDASTVELDSFRCVKLCREAGLLSPGGGLTAQELVRGSAGLWGWEVQLCTCESRHAADGSANHWPPTPLNLRVCPPPGRSVCQGQGPSGTQVSACGAVWLRAEGAGGHSLPNKCCWPPLLASAAWYQACSLLNPPLLLQAHVCCLPAPAGPGGQQEGGSPGRCGTRCGQPAGPRRQRRHRA